MCCFFCVVRALWFPPILPIICAGATESGKEGEHTAAKPQNSRQAWYKGQACILRMDGLLTGKEPYRQRVGQQVVLQDGNQRVRVDKLRHGQVEGLGCLVESLVVGCKDGVRKIRVVQEAWPTHQA